MIRNRSPLKMSFDVFNFPGNYPIPGHIRRHIHICSVSVVSDTSFDMATCSYSSLLKSTDSITCGANWKNPEDFRCVILEDCKKDVASHLKRCKVVDESVENELHLLLARAGNYLSVLLTVLFITLNRLCYLSYNAHTLTRFVLVDVFFRCI